MTVIFSLGHFLVILVTFLIGLRLSAFFSGSETGFYRASALRLGIDAQSGDHSAKSILWFLQHPSHFVATTLIGNNLANYLTTLAIGMATVYFFGEVTEALDIIATLMVAPVIFIFGELMPKFLYYQAPLSLLRRDRPFFIAFYRLFLPASLPLISVTRLLQKLSLSNDSELGGIFSRRGLVQVLGQGHDEGVLTPIQNELIQGIFEEIGSTVTAVMTPRDRIYGVESGATREDILNVARKYGVANVMVREADAPESWYAYYSVSEVAASRAPLERLKKDLPKLDATCSILNAIRQLRSLSRECAIVLKEGQIVGIVTDRGITEQMFASARKYQAAGSLAESIG